MIQLLESKTVAFHQKFSADLRALISISSQKPMELGYSWEIGQLEDHVKINDGLGATIFLSLDLCSTPKVTYVTHSSA